MKYAPLIPGLAIVMSLSWANAQDEPARERSRDPIPTMVEVRESTVRSGNQFALELHRRLAASSTDANTLCSPASVSNAMGMLYVGARGKTAREMAAAMHFDLPMDQIGQFLTLADPNRHRPLFRLGVTVVENKGEGLLVKEVAESGPGFQAGVHVGDVLLEIDQSRLRTETDFLRAIDYSTGRIELRRINASTQAEETIFVSMDFDSNEASPEHDKNQQYLQQANAVWIQKGTAVRPEYEDMLKATFGAHEERADFLADTDASIAKINRWVAKKTHDAIQELVTKDTVDSTTRLVVTNAISFKGLWLQEFDESRTEDGMFVGLNGEERSIPMMKSSRTLRFAETDELQSVEIPYRDSTIRMVILMPLGDHKLPELEAALSSRKLDSLLGSMKSTLVELQLPRFAVNSNASMKDVLQAMGMRSAFDIGAADFSGITEDTHLYLSAVVHQARIEVGEAGTTAAAATAGVAVPRGGFSTPMHVNRPFLFFLRDSVSGSIVFIGRFTSP